MTGRHEHVARRAKARRLARVLAAADPDLSADEVATVVASARVRRDAEAAAGTRPASDTTWRQVAGLLATRTACRCCEPIDGPVADDGDGPRHTDCTTRPHDRPEETEMSIRRRNVPAVTPRPGPDAPQSDHAAYAAQAAAYGAYVTPVPAQARKLDKKARRLGALAAELRAAGK